MTAIKGRGLAWEILGEGVNLLRVQALENPGKRLDKGRAQAQAMEKPEKTLVVRKKTCSLQNPRKYMEARQRTQCAPSLEHACVLPSLGYIIFTFFSLKL